MREVTGAGKGTGDGKSLLGSERLRSLLHQARAAALDHRRVGDLPANGQEAALGQHCIHAGERPGQRLRVRQLVAVEPDRLCVGHRGVQRQPREAQNRDPVAQLAPYLLVRSPWTGTTPGYVVTIQSRSLLGRVSSFMLDPSRLVATALHNSSLPSTVGTKLAALLEHYFQDRGQGIVHLCVCDGEGSIRFELTNAGARRPLFNVFSVSKAPLVVLALEVCDRLQLSLDEPVSRFWTAFETGGKSEITIRHLLDHTAGLPNMPDGIEPRAIGDWSYMTRRIGALEPLWKPGTQKGYFRTSGTACPTGRPAASFRWTRR